MSKHTPGPWVVNVDKEEGADWAYQWPTIEAADYQVVGTEGLYGDMDTDLANARLIAAAPDLLEALIAVRNIEFGTSDGDICKIRINADAAIAKAIGGML